MRGHEPTKRALAVLVALALAASGLVTVGLAESVQARTVHVNASSTIQVTASSGFMFTPNGFEQVLPNTTITVTFTDADSLPHTFTIIGVQGVVIPASDSSAQITQLAYGGHPPNLVNLNGSGDGSQTTGTFTAPGPGWYEFVCTEPGHFQRGMYGFVAFGENLPTNLTVSAPATGPGAAVFIIVGTIVSLVVIAIVLGFVVGQRRGSELEMPPERLGYAEPPASPEPPALPTSRGPEK